MFFFCLVIICAKSYWAKADICTRPQHEGSPGPCRTGGPEGRAMCYATIFYASCAVRYAAISYASCAMCCALCDDLLCATRQFPVRHARCVIRYAMISMGATKQKQLTGARVLVLRAARSSQVWCRSICACDVCTAFIPGS